MREYGQVQCAFWGHPDIVNLSNEAKILALYLLTGPHSNGLGCYRLPVGYVTEDLGLDSKTVSKRFAELSQAGFMRRCETTRHVFMPAFLRWNPVANENVAKARIKEFEEVPSQFEHIQELATTMLRYVGHWPEPFRNRLETLSQTVTETCSKQDPTRPDPEKNQPEGEPGSSTASDGNGQTPYQQIVTLYHETCTKLPKVQKLTPARRTQIAARYREDLTDLDQWREFFTRVSKAPFLNGDNDRNWRADLEWVTKQGNYAKIVEGKYDKAALGTKEEPWYNRNAIN